MAGMIFIDILVWVLLVRDGSFQKFYKCHSQCLQEKYLQAMTLLQEKMSQLSSNLNHPTIFIWKMSTTFTNQLAITLAYLV